MSGSALLSSLRLGPGWNRVRPWIVALALLAAVNLVILFALTLPRWRQARASGAAVRVNQQAQEIVGPALDRARRVYGRVQGAEQELVELRRRVASRSGSVSEVVSVLRAAVDASGLRAERISYEAKPLENLGLTQLQITLPVRGNYAQLRRFLDALLQGPVFAVVERIGVSTPGSSDPSGQLLMNVVLSAFVDGELTAPAERPNSGGGDDSAQPLPAVTAGSDPVALAQTLRESLVGLPEIPLPADAFDVKLERLDVEPQNAAASRRDLFAFANLPASSRVSDAERERERREQREARPPEPVNPYDLLGVIRTEDGLLATIADDARVYNVGAGERLPAGYRVTRVGLVDVWLEVGGREIQLSLRKERDENVRRAGPQPATPDDKTPGAAKKRKKKKPKNG